MPTDHLKQAQRRVLFSPGGLTTILNPTHFPRRPPCVSPPTSPRHSRAWPSSTATSLIDLADAGPGVPSDLRAALDAPAPTSRPPWAVPPSPPHAPRLPLAAQAFAPLVPEPGKTICLGLNYFDHAKEGGRTDKPDYPWFFYRGKSSLMGHGQPGVLPKVSAKFDYEAELAVVIGRTVPRHTKRADALQTTCSAIPASTTCRCATTRSAPASGPSARTSTPPAASARCW